MARLMPLIADRLEPGGTVADRILGWTGDPSSSGDSVPLRLAGALHALKIEGLALAAVYPPETVDDDALWRAISAALDTHAERILAWLDSPPQTNEVRRAVALLPALARIGARYGRPVALLELGASAGLNLRADRFLLELPGRHLGTHGSSVVLRPNWSGPEPEGDVPTVVARHGVDLSPIDPSGASGQLRLLAYLWPDQPDRIARTKAAISIARETPAEVMAGDAGAWAEAALANPATGRLPVLFHTVAWQYFPDETRARALAAMESCPVPMVRLSMEADGGKGAALSLTHYPSRETEALGRIDFHGRWVEWSG